jgi:TRAP-type mannitol/chloroaromatic compound transport system substrate-binding protein
MERRCSLLPFLMGLVVIGILLTGLACRRPQEAAAPAPPPAPPAAAPAAPPAAPLAPTPKPIVLKVQASWPGGTVLYENLKMFAERVEVLSGGRLKIEHMPAGAIVPAFEVLDATYKGVLDGAHTATGYWIGKHLAAGLFSNAPGGPWGMDAMDYLAWIHHGGGLELLHEFYRDILKREVVVFPIMPLAPQVLGWFKRPIRGLEDLKGLRIRVGGIVAEVYQEMGAAVVTLPGAEILPAAERGVIDAAEWDSPVSDLQLGFHNVWKHYYMPSLHEPATNLELIFNKDVWNKLPPDLQEIVKAAVFETWLRWKLKYEWENAKALRDLQTRHGVTVHRTPDEVMLKQLEVWDRIAQREAAKDPFFKKVWESQREFASLMVPQKWMRHPPYDLAASYYWKR